MDSIRVSIIQTDIVWENKQENLRLLHEKLQSLRGTTEIVVLPEMFSAKPDISRAQFRQNNLYFETMGILISTGYLWKLYCH